MYFQSLLGQTGVSNQIKQASVENIQSLQKVRLFQLHLCQGVQMYLLGTGNPFRYSNPGLEIDLVATRNPCCFDPYCMKLALIKPENIEAWEWGTLLTSAKASVTLRESLRQAVGESQRWGPDGQQTGWQWVRERAASGPSALSPCSRRLVTGGCRWTAWGKSGTLTWGHSLIQLAQLLSEVELSCADPVGQTKMGCGVGQVSVHILVVCPLSELLFPHP